MTRTPRSIVSPIQAVVLATFLLAGVLLGTVGPGMIPSASAASSFGVSESLTTGQTLTSPSNSFFAIMQGDGNFVIYQRTLMGNIAVWSTGTSRTASDTLRLQGDGNLVLYGAGRAYWASFAFASSQLSVSLQDDGNLVVVSAGRPIWSWKTGAIAPPPPPPCPTSSSSSSVGCEQVLNEGQQLAAGQYTVALQGDGNFVLYNGVTTANNAVWSTGTNNTHGVLQLVLQRDGNLVLYTPGRASAAWSTGTFGKGATSPHLELQGDGNMVLYKSVGATPGSAIWATGAPAQTTVGVYAYPSAQRALDDGWPQIAVTGALGSQGPPWVQSPNGADKATGLAIQNSGRSIPWNSYWTVSGPPGAACNGRAVLGTNAALTSGSSLSVGQLTAILQGDGNFVLYNGSAIPSNKLWSTNTGGRGGTRLEMQSDGNLVLYTSSRAAVWSSGHFGANSILALQCDGNLVTYASGGTPTWSTGTSVPKTGTPENYRDIGYVAGQTVARAIDGYGLRIKPNFVTLDPEGYPDSHSGLDAAGPAQWTAMMQGWSDGIKSIDGGLTPAFYATQSEYLAYNLRSINLPFFLAVAFGGDNTTLIPPRRLSGVDGSNIQGVVAFYYGPSDGLQCATVKSATATIASWGYRYNTLQFNPGLACHA